MRRSSKSSLSRFARHWRGALLVALVAALAGCASAGYYMQAVRGQAAMLSAAQPVDTLLADPATPDALKQRLVRARDIRRFASRELSLPDNASYTTYADVGRPVAVWNIFATPELSLELKTWCYPLFGCAAYRGFFDRAEADEFAAGLRVQGYDVSVAPVTAYSTLGWFADPLLNTFINFNDGELARLLFHELAHQVVYVKDDTTFNESFATAVERAGMARWLAAAREEPLAQSFAEFSGRRAQFQALLLRYRDELQALSAGDGAEAPKRTRKHELFDRLAADYERMRDTDWGGFRGYDRYFAQPLNNAHLAAVGAYANLVPAFEAMLARCASLPDFYDAVRRLAKLDKAPRNAALLAAAAVGPLP
jgi:predicted aminopeptidase